MSEYIRGVGWTDILKWKLWDIVILAVMGVFLWLIGSTIWEFRSTMREVKKKAIGDVRMESHVARIADALDPKKVPLCVVGANGVASIPEGEKRCQLRSF